MASPTVTVRGGGVSAAASRGLFAKQSSKSVRKQRLRKAVHAVSLPNVESSDRFTPIEAMTQLVAKFVQDALVMMQKLFQAVSRVRIAAAAIASISRAKETSGTTSFVAAERESQQGKRVLRSVVEEKNDGAPRIATSLQHTLNDVTGTLEAKWKALESSLESRAGDLFSATQKSATALQSIQGSSAATLRLWSLETTASVLKHEEELRQQVFEKVLAELEARDGRSQGLAY
jgi:hypothetical protein